MNALTFSRLRLNTLLGTLFVAGALALLPTVASAAGEDEVRAVFDQFVKASRSRLRGALGRACGRGVRWEADSQRHLMPRGRRCAHKPRSPASERDPQDPQSRLIVARSKTQVLASGQSIL